MTAQKVYEKLMQTGIISATGEVTFEMLNIKNYRKR